MVSPENIILFGSGSKVQVLQKNVKNYLNYWQMEYGIIHPATVFLKRLKYIITYVHLQQLFFYVILVQLIASLTPIILQLGQTKFFINPPPRLALMHAYKHIRSLDVHSVQLHYLHRHRHRWTNQSALSFQSTHSINTQLKDAQFSRTYFTNFLLSAIAA